MQSNPQMYVLTREASKPDSLDLKPLILAAFDTAPVGLLHQFNNAAMFRNIDILEVLDLNAREIMQKGYRLSYKLITIPYMGRESTCPKIPRF